MNVPGGLIRSRRAYVAPNGNIRRILKVVASKKLDRVERLQLRSPRRIGQRISHAKALHGRAIIWQTQPDYLAILQGWLRQQISVERLQLRSPRRIGQRISHAKALHGRAIIWQTQPDYLAILQGWLRQQISV